MYERREELREQAASCPHVLSAAAAAASPTAPPPLPLWFISWLSSELLMFYFVHFPAAECRLQAALLNIVKPVQLPWFIITFGETEENTQNWQHYPLSRNTIGTCILAVARCILYKPTKLMVSITSLAPPHLSYLPQVGKEKVSEAVESNFN